jgi:hypothetical protein
MQTSAPASAATTQGENLEMSETHKLTPLAPQDVPEAAPRLEDLARQARDAHVAAGQAVNDAVRQALAAGRALIAARDLVPKGRWTEGDDGEGGDADAPTPLTPVTAE